MMRTRFLQTAAALMFLFPLGSGAVSDTKRELSAASPARAGVTGRDLAIQVASGNAWGLRGHYRVSGQSDGESDDETSNPLPERLDHPFVAPTDRDGGGATPVPEPSSMVLFAGSLLLTRAVVRRREGAAGPSWGTRNGAGRPRLEADLEQRLEIAERAIADAQTSSRPKDEFLAMHGHELRNSLSAVRNAVVCVRLDSRRSERALGIAWQQTEQLDRLVEDLLDVTQIAQGCFQLNRQRVALMEIIEHAVEAMRFLIEDRGHKLAVLHPADRVCVDGRIELVAERQDAEAVLHVRDSRIEISANLLPGIRPLRPVGALARARARWAQDRARSGAKPRPSRNPSDRLGER
jgi:signal transduction histidine kinase